MSTKLANDDHAAMSYYDQHKLGKSAPIIQGSHSFLGIKTRDFSKTFHDQTRCFNDLYRKFHYADMLKIHYLNRETCPSQLFRKAHSIALNDFSW